MDNGASSATNSTGGRWRLLKSVVAIDPRSLATCRIALGVLLLVDLAMRVPDLAAMNSNAGVMPIEQVRRLFEGTWRWSIYWLDGSYWFQAALFVLAGLFALALLVGWQTRLATIGCWMLLASLHTRGPLIINAGDSLMRMLLFWGMFVPWGRIWSVDAWRTAGGRANRLRPVASAGTAALLLQVCIVYWFTAIYKLMNENWQVGDGLHNALAWGGYNKPVGIFLLERPEWMTLLSYGTILLELIGPTLVLLPWGRRYLRPIVIAVFFSFHIGIELCMYVGLFSYVSMAAWTLFLPGEFWNGTIWQRLGFSESRSADDASIMSAATPGRGWVSAAVSGVCGLLLVFLVAYNVYGLMHLEAGRKMPPAMRHAGEVTVLEQRWSMFVRPMPASNWFVAKARLRDGRRVDLLRGGAPLDFSRPNRIALLYPNHRWRKYFLALITGGPALEPFRQTLCDYQFQSWNRNHGPEEQAVLLELYCFYMRLSGDDSEGELVGLLYARTVAEDGRIEDTIDFFLPFENEKETRPGDLTGF